MGKGINKAIILGNVGQDPEMRYTADGKAVANLSVATSEQWKDRNTGRKQEKTEWHRIVAFGRLAEIIEQYIKKGSQIYIEGKNQTRKWQDQNGQERYTTEIVASELQMLGGGRGHSEEQEPHQQSPQQQQHQNAGGNFDDFDDDIPF